MTSEKPSETYPTWAEMVDVFPKRWRPALSGSVARLISMDRGYVVDVSGFDESEFSSMCKDVEFRNELTKKLIPWAYHHPVGKPRRCVGLVFGTNLVEDTPVGATLRTELGAQLTGFSTRIWPLPDREEKA